MIMAASEIHDISRIEERPEPEEKKIVVVHRQESPEHHKET
jgi:hypothetical protein